ncbi:MAG TPA: LLM class flavin-dependent oxidoreductase [Acidimicrobiia bacterium]|nr:LLM class flavin-dependent oxidoreductase [Acidimicrobiia bacterium]
MRIGVGLPTTTPGTDGNLVIEWARRADAGPFSSLGVVDRVAYPSLEPIAALSAAAAVTDNVRLVTMVVIGPLRSPALLAQQAATLDLLSEGRLTLGLSIGARHDDYDVCGIDPRRRGEILSDQLAEIRQIWEDGTAGPTPNQPGGPDVLVGGSGGPAMQRMARSSDGFVHGGGPPRAFAAAAERARSAWIEAGRPGSPQLWGQAYFALGDVERGAAYLRDYYAFTGGFAERIAAANLTTPNAVLDLVRGYRDAGCHHLVLLPTVSDLDQLERLSEVVGQ